MDDEQENPKAVWEKRQFRLNEKMKDVCRLSIAATEAEINALRRKLEKLQYGGK